MEARITEMSGIECPIIQGGMAWVAEHNLTAAVSEADGFRLVGGISAPEEVVCDEIHKARGLTDKPFGANVMLLSPHADDVAKVAVEEGIEVVTTDAGNPEKYMEMWKAVGIKVIPVVTSVALARRMKKHGADAAVAEDMGSSGRIGEQTTMTLAPQVANAVPISVIMTGGIGDGRGMAMAFTLGAEVVQMGTRFVVTKESIIHGNYKQRIVKTKDIDSTVTGRSHDHPVRGFRNQMIREYIKLEQKSRSFEESEYLTLGALRKAVIGGNVNSGTVMAGQIADMIFRRQTCKEMIEEIMAQAGKLMHRNQGPGTQAPDWMETNRIQDKEITSISKIVFISPRQGTQAYGMGKDFYEQTKTGKKVFDKATQLTGFSMPQLCFEENDRLDITEYTQTIMIIASITMMRVLEESGVKPDVAAGLSPGEYCALAVAGVISDEDAIWAAHQRGILMQEAVPVGENTVAAILALDAAAIKEVTGTMEGVWIANYNYPGQIVVSGGKAAAEEACEKLKAAGAERAVMLNVSGLFHSGTLTTAGEEPRQVLSRVRLHEPWIPHVINITAQYVKSTVEVKELFIRQISSSVRWQQSVGTMTGDSVNAFIEIGPDKTLVGFMRKISRDAKTFNVGKLGDIGKTVEALKL